MATTIGVRPYPDDEKDSPEKIKRDNEMGAALALAQRYARVAPRQQETTYTTWGCSLFKPTRGF